jgi:hypothetical protein
MIGERFGRLVVQKYAIKRVASGKTVRVYSGICDCGNMFEGIVGRSLREGRTKSCGCLRKELAEARRITNSKWLLDGVDGEILSQNAMASKYQVSPATLR